jgi:hypothetical protein
MDFIVSYYMYNKIKKQEMKEMKKNINSNEESPCDPPRLPDQRQEREQSFIKRNCCKCGQYPYFCQCNEIIKLMYRNFNPEQNSY